MPLQGVGEGPSRGVPARAAQLEPAKMYRASGCLSRGRGNQTDRPRLEPPCVLISVIYAHWASVFSSVKGSLIPNSPVSSTEQGATGPAEQQQRAWHIVGAQYCYCLGFLRSAHLLEHKNCFSITTLLFFFSHVDSHCAGASCPQSW